MIFNIEQRDIEKCHRIGKNKDGKQTIIISFVSHHINYKIYSLKKHLKGSNSLSVKILRQLEQISSRDYD